MLGSRITWRSLLLIAVITHLALAPFVVVKLSYSHTTKIPCSSDFLTPSSPLDVHNFIPLQVQHPQLTRVPILVLISFLDLTLFWSASMEILVFTILTANFNPSAKCGPLVVLYQEWLWRQVQDVKGLLWIGDIVHHEHWRYAWSYGNSCSRGSVLKIQFLTSRIHNSPCGMFYL